MVSKEVYNKWKAGWVGRKFRDTATGKELEIPENIRMKEFFSFGESFVDVGDEYYSRAGGVFEEITEEGSGYAISENKVQQEGIGGA